MTVDHTRRRLLQGGTALAGAAATGWVQSLLAAPVSLGEGQQCDFDGLVARARKLAQQPHAPPHPRHGALLDSIDYDAQRKIKSRADQALWIESGSPFAVEFFHLNKTARVPVAINVVADGVS